MYSTIDPINIVDPSGLLTEFQCKKIRELLEYEKEHGTRRTANAYSDTWGERKLGR
jgi:hypothetical protein